MTETPDLTVIDYTEKSFILIGDSTKQYKEWIKEMGGKFNRYLKSREGFSGGPGWIFPQSLKDTVEEFVDKVMSGNVSEFLPPTEGHNSDGSEIPVEKESKSLNYVWVKYKIFQPRVGMVCELKCGGAPIEGTVVNVLSSRKNIVDTAMIQFKHGVSRACICNGKWAIFGYRQSHSLFFREQES